MPPGAAHGASEPPRAGAHPTIVRRPLGPAPGSRPDAHVRVEAQSLPGGLVRHNRTMVPTPDPHPALPRCVALSVASMLVALPGHAASESVAGASGLVAAIDAQSGRYEIRSQQAEWTFAGRLASAASQVVTKDGQDRLGAFRELGFRWRDRMGLRGSIRAYIDRPVLLFTITSDEPVSDPDRKSTRLNSSHTVISYAVFCLKKKTRESP